MAAAGLGTDLLLANEVLDARRLGAAGSTPGARVTVAVDSDETIAAAAAGGVREVLIDVERRAPPLRLPARPTPAAWPTRPAAPASRCAASWATRATWSASRTAPTRGAEVAESMELLRRGPRRGRRRRGLRAAAPAPGTCNTLGHRAAGRLVPADGHRLRRRSTCPSGQALSLLATVISVNPEAAAPWPTSGLKALGMDHGNPTVVDRPAPGLVLLRRAPHLRPPERRHPVPGVGDRVRVHPGHVDPTVALPRAHATWSAATRWSTPGPSTSATGDRPPTPGRPALAGDPRAPVGAAHRASPVGGVRAAGRPGRGRPGRGG